MNSLFFDWVRTHSDADPSALRLRFAGKSGPEGLDVASAILQIECRKRCARKLHRTLDADPDFFFPTALSAEQCSSDALAAFHASLVPPDARTAVDLTSGLGIDAMALARRGLRVTALDRQSALCEALRHNSRALQAFTVVEADCRIWIDEAVEKGLHFDVAFIDPARRDDAGGRVYALGACTPDVVALVPKFARICSVLIIKASPMLDVSHTLIELSQAAPRAVIAAGTTGECKELIAVCDFSQEQDAPYIRAVTLADDGTPIADFEFTQLQEREAPALNAGPGISGGMWLMEPYPSTMKCGAHKALADRFGLWAFDANTHLYYCSGTADAEDSKAGNFPGEAFRVLDVQEYASKNIKRLARTWPALSVTARNFGLTAEQLRRKLGVKDGDGSLRLFALTDARGIRLMIITARPDIK